MILSGAASRALEPLRYFNRLGYLCAPGGLLIMNTQDGTTLSRIGQIAINAHDVDRATAFYRDIILELLG